MRNFIADIGQLKMSHYEHLRDSDKRHVEDAVYLLFLSEFEGVGSIVAERKEENPVASDKVPVVLLRDLSGMPPRVTSMPFLRIRKVGSLLPVVRSFSRISSKISRDLGMLCDLMDRSPGHFKVIGFEYGKEPFGRRFKRLRNFFCGIATVLP